MTAQLVLVNQSGVAVSSDTMVTVGHQKTLATAAKITDLSAPNRNHKVVVLTSGRSEVGGVRWDLILREWAMRYPGALPELTEYPEHILGRATTFNDLVSGEDSATAVLCSRMDGIIRDNLANEMQRALHAAEHDGDGLLPQELTDYLISEFAGLISAWKAGHVAPGDDEPVHFFKGFPFEDAKKFVRTPSMQRAICFEFQHHLPGFREQEDAEWVLSGELLEAALDLSAHLIGLSTSTRTFSGWPTILGFAGFGTDDPMGGGVVTYVAGIYLGKVWATSDPRMPEVGSVDGSIIYLAQQDAIADFTRGLDQARRGIVREAASIALHDAATKIGLENSEQLMAEFNENFYHRLGHYLWHDFEGPFRRTMESLALGPLSNLTEALVKVQALRAMSSSGMATVGGVIESLTIDRVDGVKWRRRLDDDSSSQHDLLGL